MSIHTTPQQQQLSDEQLTILAKQRADRLRRLRNLANLDRKELCDGAALNINTYIGYEVGKYGGLTLKSARKVIDFLISKGVFSSLEWLMHGTEPSPKVITDLSKLTDLNNELHAWQLLNTTNTMPAQTPSLDETCIEEDTKIMQELLLFRSHYQDTIEHCINDDTMLPIYQHGNYVAGICYTGIEINNLIGLDCIVQIINGATLVRTVQQGREQGSYTLTCRNPNTKINYPILYDVKLSTAANIIWHRKRLLNLK